MNAIGFEKIRERWKEGGKMAYWLFQKRASSEFPLSKSTTRYSGGQPCFDKKVMYREGGGKNNFCILL
jgi:25S rRNA (adenine2142-N1)-methyltransferase